MSAGPSDPVPDVRARPARLVVTLGTTHHRADRVSGWLEGWLGEHPDVTCLFQHGTSRPIDGARCVAMLPRSELVSAQEHADVVVVQGGTGSVMDARSVGRKPIVVPRRPDLEEVVDDHQIAFARRLDRMGWAIDVESAADFASALSAAMADPTTVQIPIEPSPVPATAARLAQVLDDLANSRVGFVSLRRLRQVRGR